MAGYSNWKNTFLMNSNTVRLPPLQCFANGPVLLEDNNGSGSVNIDLIVDFLTQD